MTESLTKKSYLFRRIFEIVPGLISWSLLILFIATAAAKPIAGAILVLLFNLFWVFRLFYMTTLIVLSYSILDQERDTDWQMRCKELMNLSEFETKIKERLNGLYQEIKKLHRSENKIKLVRKFRSQTEYLHRVERLVRAKTEIPDYGLIYHAVILPAFREDMRVLKDTLNSIRNANYPLDRMIVVVAFEDREGEGAKLKAEELYKSYTSVFFNFLVTFHPDGLPGETPVKGANASWAAKRVKEFLEKQKIPLQNVLISCFDADTCVTKEYFSSLTYHFLIREDRMRCSFQPIPVYHNNVWEVPAFARMMDTGSSFGQLIESADPDHLVTFSSHSMNFQTLVDVNYWPVDMISDDSAIFWRCFLHFDGHYKTVPLNVTLSMSIIVGENWFDTFIKIYKQKRRWAWGIENFPMIMEGFAQNPRIPLSVKITHGLKMLENHVSWATWGLIISLFGWLPVIWGGREYGLSVISYNLPKISAMIFQMAGLSVIVTLAISFLLLPKRPSHVSRFKNLTFILQFFFLPVILATLLALPALDAQTRLMLGRYMQFQVSSKVRQERE